MINKILKELREKKKLSRQQLADIFEISKRTIESYEYGNREPNIDMINKFADFYGVTADYLLGREPQTNPLAELNLNLKLDDEKFIEFYSELPEVVKQIFVDTMSKLSQAAQQMPKDTIRKSTTYTCGEIEDMRKAEQEKGVG